jgi:hypothetical protein
VETPHPLAAQATAELKKSSYREIRRVVCEARDDVLRLTGSVPTYFHKQVAQQSLIKMVAGARRIENRLQVG